MYYKPGTNKQGGLRTNATKRTDSTNANIPEAYPGDARTTTQQQKKRKGYSSRWKHSSGTLLYYDLFVNCITVSNNAPLPPSAPTADRRGVTGRVFRPTKCRPKRTALFCLNPNTSDYCKNGKISKKRLGILRYQVFPSGCGSRI